MLTHCELSSRLVPAWPRRPRPVPAWPTGGCVCAGCVGWRGGDALGLGRGHSRVQGLGVGRHWEIPEGRVRDPGRGSFPYDRSRGRSTRIGAGLHPLGRGLLVCCAGERPLGAEGTGSGAGRRRGPGGVARCCLRPPQAATAFGRLFPHLLLSVAHLFPISSVWLFFFNLCFFKFYFY